MEPLLQVRAPSPRFCDTFFGAGFSAGDRRRRDHRQAADFDVDRGDVGRRCRVETPQLHRLAGQQQVRTGRLELAGGRVKASVVVADDARKDARR